MTGGPHGVTSRQSGDLGLHPEAPGCRVCGSRDGEVIVIKDGTAIRRCPRCAVASTPSEPMPAVALYDDSYFTGVGGHYVDYIADERTHRRQARRYLRRLERAGATGGTILDVGCAAGFFLDEARAAGWRTAGLEVSEYAARHARTRLGVDVIRAAFPDTPLASRAFDVVTLFNVFEHLEHPRDVIAELARLVRPGGLVAIETWDYRSLAARMLGARWHQYDPRFVPYYYSVDAMRYLFAAEDWQLRQWRRAPKWISFGRGLSVLGGALRDGPVRRALAAIGASPLGRVDVPYFTGDLVFALLERR